MNNGHVLSGIATDDLHRTGDLGNAWTMIKATSLTEKGIVEALENGCFYASKGPEIMNCQLDRKGKIKVDCSAAKKIIFRTSGAGNGKVFKAKSGEELFRAEWDISRKKPMWVRCEVTDENGNSAWTNPIFP